MDNSVVAEKKEIKKLLEINEELENYFRNTIIPQLFVDADLILRKFSPPANMHFNLVAADIGKPIAEIDRLAHLPGLVENITEVISSNQDMEREIQTNDKRWFQMNILPYFIKKENRTNGVVITFVDITGRVNDKRDIERLNADHETFIYSVSHDFRAPLGNLVILIELLKTATLKKDIEESEKLLEMVDKSARVMRNMINELTDLSKIGSEPDDRADIIHVESILEEVKFTLKDQIYQSHAKITTSLDIPDLHFSRKNLRSILYNLLSNAIKFVQPEKTPEIFIRTEKAGEYLLLSVKDSGVGIEEEKQKEIFLKFTRLRPEVQGTGIGLFIVSKMIENHGGKIEVDSKPGKGTTFNIYLKN
ncbi:MAG TPA: ATP-binding protein [Cyclobacteriaceae bacterium]|jgi:two-component system phosphate regulon sensor histidine kinase PhoR|nr:ATP-binding protein [Cyclobacteriaceae bacterium]